MKNLRTWVIAATLGLFGLGGWAWSQNAGQVVTTMLGSELIQLTQANTAAIGYTTVNALRDGRGYLYNVPTTGFTINLTVAQSALSLNPAGTLATGTVVMPATILDGKVVSVFTTQTITALTLSTTNGATFTPAAVTTLVAGANVNYVYSVTANTWYRIE
jgi:hypothetical protein